MRKPLRTNKDKLVCISARATITSPAFSVSEDVNFEGKRPIGALGIGGINYTVRVGDKLSKYIGDHIEPGVSAGVSSEAGEDSAEETGLMSLSCLGNEVIVADRDKQIRWRKGWVTGKHGGVNHILIDFDNSTLNKLAPGDNLLVKAVGQGLQLLDFPDVRVMNIDPGLLDSISINVKKIGKRSRLIVPVTAIVPSVLGGSGLGSVDSTTTDYDIMNSDANEWRKYGLHKLKFGDIIALKDIYAPFGACLKKGAWSIGVVIHGTCIYAGHGPGIVIILTDNNKTIVPNVVPKSNVKYYQEKRKEKL